MKHYVYVVGLQSGRALSVVAPNVAALAQLQFSLPDGSPDPPVSMTRAAEVHQIVIEQPEATATPVAEPPLPSSR